MSGEESPARVGSCPDQLTLHAYSFGAIPSARLDEIAGHVSSCPRCEALLGNFRSDDALILNLRECVSPGEGSPAPVERPYRPAGHVTAFGQLPRRFGAFELLEKLGAGGMAVVFKARQERPRRLVALKIPVWSPLLDGEAISRFLREGEAMARLEHGNIVRVFECGEAEGLPYFSMEYVEGGTLAQRISAAPLPEREAAQLVSTLARAVEFAHRQGVIHRDLKPANVLLGTEGVAKLTDFGLAKLRNADDVQTRSHAVLGTAKYMAPEQAGGGARNVGPAADVYGLGAILYESLTAAPPFGAGTPEETLRQVLLNPPVPPLCRRPGLCRQLEAICLKCLEKEPARRYPSAGRLANDLESWLAGRPTEARPVSAWNWACRWARRRLAAISIAAAALVALGLLLAGAAWHTRRTEQEELDRRRVAYDMTIPNAWTALERAEFSMAAHLLDSVVAPPGKTDLRGFEWRHLWRYAGVSHRIPPPGFVYDGGPAISRCVTTDADGNVYVGATCGPPTHFGRQDGKLVYDSSADQAMLVAKITPAGALVWARRFGGPNSNVTGIAVDGSGSVYTVGSCQSTIRFGEGPEGNPISSGRWTGFLQKLTKDGDLAWVRPLTSSGSSRVRSVALDGRGGVHVAGVFDQPADFNPGSQPYLRMPLGRADAFLAKYDAAGRFRWVRTLGGPGNDNALELTADEAGNLFLAGMFSGPSLRVSATGDCVADGDGPGVAFLCKLDGDGRLAWQQALGGRPEGCATGVALDRAGHVYCTGYFRGPADQARLHTGNRRLHAGMDDAYLGKFDATTGTRLWMHTIGSQDQEEGGRVAVDANGTVYLTGSFNGTVDFDAGPGSWCLTGAGDRDAFLARFDGEGRLDWVTALAGPALNAIAGLAVDHAGNVVISGWLEGTGYLDCGEYRLVFGPSGSLVLAKLVPPPPVGHPRRPHRYPPMLSLAPNEVWSLAFAPDGKTLVVGADHTPLPESLTGWDWASGTRLFAPPGHGVLVSCVAVSPDGACIAAGDYHDNIKLWHPATGQELATLSGHQAKLRALAFSPDSRWLASGGKDKVLRVWDVATGRIRCKGVGHVKSIRAVAFTSNNREVVTASQDTTWRVWDAATGRLRRTVQDSGELHCLALNPKGTQLATGNRDGQVALWDLATGEELARWSAHQGELRAIAISPDGRTLATAGVDRTVRLWNAHTRAPLLSLHGHQAEVNALAFSPRGDYLASASHDGAIRLWHAPRDP